MADISMGLPRRRFLQLLIAVPAAWFAGLRFLGLDDYAAAAALFAASSPDSAAHAKRVAPTPDCGDDDEPTPAETEGPFFTPRSPERTSLIEPGMPGTRIVLTGRALSPGCRPLAGAL